MATELRDYILQVVTIADVYDKIVIPLDPKRFHLGGLSARRTVICPFHTDNDPSLGLLKDKFKEGVFRYHCFGCGATGDVVRMFQRIYRLYLGKEMTEDECMQEMVKIFDIDITKAIVIEESHPFAKLMRSRLSIKRAEDRYTIRDYQRDLIEIRRKQHQVPMNEAIRGINSATLKMLVTEKDLLY